MSFRLLIPFVQIRKNDPQSLLKLKQLRQEFERARMLLEMIKKRERVKQELVIVSKSLFEGQVEHMKNRAKKRGWIDTDEDLFLAVDVNQEEPEEQDSNWMEIFHLPNRTPFWGRARVGRGGRVWFDRGRPPVRTAPTSAPVPVPVPASASAPVSGTVPGSHSNDEPPLAETTSTSAPIVNVYG